MFKNYFIVAIRNLWKRKVFSFINIAGLAIGISAALVIFLLVNYHFSFDQFQKNKDRLYRVVTDFNFSGEEYHNSGVVFPMAKAAKKEIIPGVGNRKLVSPFPVRRFPKYSNNKKE
jgi:putative ABC transport system permease protein